jgi:ferredoxin/flavodoxin---NADP+ reductase
MIEDKMYDVTIIGGGPVGLYTAFYSGMRNLKTKIIDAQTVLGGKVSFFYPEKRIYDIGGIPSINGDDLIANLVEQANLYKPTIIRGEVVKQVEKQADQTFILITENGQMHFSKTVVITAGMGTFKQEKLQLDNAEAFENKNLHYSINDIERFRGKKVMVSGGTGGAVNWATLLSKYADQVLLVNDKTKFVAHKGDLDQLEQSSVHVRANFSIVELVESHGIIQSVILKNLADGHTYAEPIDELVVNHGAKIRPEAMNEWGIQLDKFNKITIDSFMQTNLPGVFAAGDLVNYPNKTTLIASGFSEAMTAINSVALYLDPTVPKIIYSTVIVK